MRSRRLDIMVHIIDRLLDDPQALDDVEGLVETLVLRGMQPGEARHAVGWLLAALEELGAREERVFTPGASSSSRVFERTDGADLSLEAQGFLLELRELGLLDPLQLEEIVEQALHRGTGPWGREDIKPIVAEVLLRSASSARGGLPHWSVWESDEGSVH